VEFTVSYTAVVGKTACEKRHDDDDDDDEMSIMFVF
jgi:hypothetical protein